MTYTELAVEAERRCLAHRGMARLVNQLDFQEAWKLDPNNELIVTAIRAAKVDFVRQWMNNTLMKAMEVPELSIHVLRRLASNLGIRSYTIYNKDQLIILIMKERNAKTLKASEASGHVSLDQCGSSAEDPPRL